MSQIEKQKGRTQCREGPKLETFNSIWTDHCGNRTAMVTSSSSIVRSAANAFDATAEHVTAEKLDGCSGNARSDCSTETMSILAAPSLPNTSSKRDIRMQYRPQRLRVALNRHGRTAMSDISNIGESEYERILWMKLSRVLVSPNGFLNPGKGHTIVKRAW